MSVVLEKSNEEPVSAEETVDVEALIREARARQRRRRLIALAAALVLISAGLVVWRVAFAGEQSATDVRLRGAGVARPRTVTVRIVGAVTPLQGFNPGGACPDGKFSWSIQSSAGETVGTDSECDLAASKVDRPNWGVFSTHGVIAARYTLQGGTILTQEQRSFHFSRQTVNGRLPITTHASISGRIVGGSGRYAHARGSISGGGLSLSDKANWTVVFHFH